MANTVNLDIPHSAVERVANGIKKQSAELTLLLTVARVLRAYLREVYYPEREDDLQALKEAILAFEPDEPLSQAVEAYNDGVPFSELIKHLSPEEREALTAPPQTKD